MIASTISDIVSLKYEDTASLSDYVSQVKVLHNKLHNMTQENETFQLPDNVLAIFMLINLPTNEFHHIIQSLFSNKVITVKQVTDRLVSEAALLKNLSNKETAMYGFKSSLKNKTKKPGINNNPPKPTDQCHIHKFGSHTNAECNTQKNKAAGNQPPKTCLPSANAAVVAGESNPEPEIASIAIENVFVIVHDPDIDYYSFTSDFIADSGASIHLVNNYNMLINPVKCEPKLVNTAKSGTQVKVNVKGSVRVLAQNKFDQRVSVNIPNVFYVAVN
jgi:hypothetical protein